MNWHAQEIGFLSFHEMLFQEVMNIVSEVQQNLGPPSNATPPCELHIISEDLALCSLQDRNEAVGDGNSVPTTWDRTVVRDICTRILLR